MEVLFSAIAHAGGVEIPADRRIFPAKATAHPLPDKAEEPGLLRRGLGHLCQGIGKGTLALSERLLAGPHREPRRAMS
ncbi:MAG TPA: hypothetical protein VKN76_18325 [Kiloniellaceae bacterium]|nr:hypothetical protein [Kiloniellaceae bacterium]